MRRTLGLSSLFAGLAVSGCQCDVPFDRAITITLETEVGGSNNCALTDEVLDSDGNAVTTGGFGEVHYNYEHNGTVDPPPVDPTDPNAPTTCTVHVVRWSGDLADMSDIKADIDAGVSEQGLNPDSATVTVAEVAFGTITLDVVTAGDDAFPLDNVGPYNAHMNITDGEASVDDAIVINNPGTGAVAAEHITTTSEAEALGALIGAALNGGGALGGTGNADISFGFADLGDLTNDGNGAPRMVMTVELQVTGSLAVGL
jgi:hypothetical protein